jgi:hypothetical protein
VVKVAGPTRAGETIEVTLRLGEEWPRVLLRAVDEEGRPVARAELHLRVFQEPLSPQRARLWTDPDGRAELQLLGPHRPDYRRTLEIEVYDPVPRRGEADLSFEMEHGNPTDLGEVVLLASETVLLAAGSVRGESGPIAGAQIEAWPRTNWSTGRRRTTADASGRFELRGLPTEERLWLTASAPGHASSPPLEIDPGSRGLTVELPRAALLELEILLDETIRPEALSLVLISGSRSLPLSPLLRGRIEVPAGLHDVEVCNRAGLLLERIPGLRIEPPPVGIDPRLRPLDLRGRLRSAAFDLRDGNGRPLERTQVGVILVAGGSEAAGSLQTENGRLSLVVPVEASTIVLAPDGFAPRKVAIQDAPVEVVFSPR